MAHLQPLEARRLFAAAVPVGFSDAGFGSSIADGTAMAFAPDGRLFVLSQGGVVRVVQPNGTTNTALTLSVNQFSERGLIGIAFSPTFASDHHLFLYYTEVPSGQANNSGAATRNRISRFTVNGNAIDPSSETVILRLDPLSAGNHNGGGMAFGPDGKLYVGVGENGVQANAQSSNNRLGKVLRLNPDGSVPSDNPSAIDGIGATSGSDRAIYVAGLRNPYTIAFDPADTSGDGTLFINDVGQSTFEEINVAGRAKNYGWGETEGFFDAAASANANFTEPLYVYGHGSTPTTGRAISGGAFYRSDTSTRFPDAYAGRYFFGDFVSGWINVINPASPPSAVSGATNFATNTPGIVDLDVGPDGALYYLARGGNTPGVRRITFAARPTVSLSRTGTLTINGTAADDEVVLNRKGSKLRVISNGASTLFSNAKVKRVRVNAGDGDDVVKLGGGVRGIFADGGIGDDLLAGGENNDTLVGGDGLDTLFGNEGNDSLTGGGGRDTILAGAGNDSLLGGTSVDLLDGGAGTDQSDNDRREKRVSIEVLV